jgi:hypothetical protein
MGQREHQVFALGPPFVKAVVAWQARKQSKQGRPVPIKKLLKMRLTRSLEQNRQTSGFAERNFGVRQATSLAKVARIVLLGLFLELQILVVKLRVDERGDIVDQGGASFGDWMSDTQYLRSKGTKAPPPFV